MFELYDPENKIPEVLYLKNSDGVDWYEYRANLKSSWLKVVYQEDRRIMSYSMDASMLWPKDMSVGQIHPSKIPEGFSLEEAIWYFDGTNILRHITTPEEFKAIHKKEFDIRYENLSREINYLEDTGKDSSKERALRVKLYELDLGVETVHWPE